MSEAVLDALGAVLILVVAIGWDWICRVWTRR